MPIPVKMAKFGLAMTEGTLHRWLVAEGDRVEKGQPIAEVETAKAINELEATAAGTLAKCILGEGETAPVGQTIAWVLAKGETAESVPEAAPIDEPPAMQDAGPGRAAPAASPVSASRAADARLKISPVARRLAAELGVDLTAVAGTGPEGSIVRQDVLQAAEPPRGPLSTGRLVPFSAMRKEIVSTVNVSGTIPQIVLYSRVDATALRAVRRSDDAILWCVARALKDNEYLNASYEDAGIRLHDDVNIAFPVSVDQGLVMPVIRNVDRLSLASIGAERKRLVNRVRSKDITTKEISGGTFTVSNLSMYPVDRFKALISPGQAAILSAGRIRREPVAVGKDVVVHPTMEFGLTVDHRVADGVAAAVFLKDLVSRIESLNLEDMEHERET